MIEFNANVAEATTNKITVSISTKYYLEGSEQEKNNNIWLYKVKIENFSEHPIQILQRYWQIIDAKGIIEEVEGEGVVGHQPIIKSMEGFEYTSQVKLFEDSGLMKGKYYGINLEDKSDITIDIPFFSLDKDEDLRKYS